MARPVEKKQDIEDAAIRLFATKGLARTTIKDIAREAGVTEGALYRHYAGKNEMAWQLFCQELERFATELASKMFTADGMGERLDQSIRCIFDYHKKNPVQFAFIMLTQHGFPEEQYLDEQINPNDMAIRFVREAQEVREIPKQDPVLLAGLVMGMILQPIVMHQYKRLKITPEVVDEVVAAAKRVLQID